MLPLPARLLPLFALLLLGPRPDARAQGDVDKQVPAVKQLVAEAMREQKLQAVLVGLSVGGKEVLLLAEGDAMTRVPATAAMHFRNGNVAVAYLANLLYQLADAGKLSPDDPVGKWLPGLKLPEADKVTLEMLLNGTAGYPDFMPMDAFRKRLYADPFHHWTPEELIQLAFTEKPAFAPGTDWNYAHTNFVILGLALEKAGGKPLAELMREHVLTPFGMTQTADPGTPAIPEPVLHAFTAERGPYEDATFWSPSWTLAHGAIQTSTLRDTLKGMRAVGRGERLKPETFQRMLAPKTAGMKIWTQDRYYAQGIVVTNDWLMQAPSFHGFFGAAGHHPEADITLAVWATQTIDRKEDGNPAQAIFLQIAGALTGD